MNGYKLAGEALVHDPRIIQAKQLLLETVKSHQKNLDRVRPPRKELVETYDELLKKYSSYRAGNLWFPFIGSGIGNGALVELLDGSVKYDFIAGIGPHFFGHSHPEIIAACIDAALSDTVMQGNLQQNKDSYELTELLLTQSKMDHCFLTSSGAMANENALKIAFQKRSPAHRVLAFEKCFVGRTLAVSSITDKAAFREGLPTVLPVDYVPFYDESDPSGSTDRALKVIQKYIARYPNQHAVMCFELVQGEAGFYAGKSHFFEAIMKLLKEHNIVIFDDEVQSFGRTEEMFAFHFFGLQEYVDIVSIGKLSQVCATLFRRDMAPKPGLLSQTFTASNAAIKSSTAILSHLIQGGYYGAEGKIAKIHRYFVDKLLAISKKHPSLIRGPYGVGCMIAMTPFDGSTQKVTQFVKDLFYEGVMAFIAGSNPTRVRFLLPAGCITEEDMDRGIEIIERTLIRASNV